MPDKLVKYSYLFQWPSCSSALTCYTLVQWDFSFVLIRVETGTNLNKYYNWVYKSTLVEWARHNNIES